MQLETIKFGKGIRPLHVNPWMLDDILYKLNEKDIESWVWEWAFADKLYLKTCMKHWFGWDGGTIHQVIRKLKALKSYDHKVSDPLD